jgi:hypothetical protein
VRLRISSTSTSTAITTTAICFARRLPERHNFHATAVDSHVSAGRIDIVNFNDDCRAHVDDTCAGYNNASANNASTLHVSNRTGLRSNVSVLLGLRCDSRL